MNSYYVNPMAMSPMAMNPMTMSPMSPMGRQSKGNNKMLIILLMSSIMIIMLILLGSPLFGVNEEKLGLVSPPPFECTYLGNTGYNHYGKGNVHYLDRHNINCPNGVLNRMRLIGPKGSIRYDYTCCSAGIKDNSIKKSTKDNQILSGQTQFLDRHELNCGPNGVIQQMKLLTPGKNKIRYDYTCVNVPNLKCRELTTKWNDNKPRTSIYLDRHDVKCGPNEALQKVKLDTQNYGEKIRYRYTCCKV